MTVPAFTVLHVCMGNICRSPMAERLLVAAVAGIAPDRAGELIRSTSAGTGGWHVGEPMNPPASRQVLARGGDDTGFVARRLHAQYVDAADLVLTATADQVLAVRSLRPDAGPRAFVIGEFGRLLPLVDLAALPPAGLTPQAVHRRGVALVAAVDAVRDRAEPLPSDELDDPWGRGDAYFARVADEIDVVVGALAGALLRDAPGP